jgi:peptidoglycan-associated lipoprotein
MCGAECLDNSECGSSEFCDEGSCTAKPECGPNADKTECDGGYECESGKCVERFTECRPSEPVYFDFDRSNIKRSEKSKLDEVAECFKGDHVARMTIGGHTDEEGDVSYNMALGEERANSVRKYLERVGVNSSLLNPVSYGEDRPAVNGAGRQPKNRRVEFER